MFDESQIGLPGSNRLLEKQLQMSGLEHNILPAIVTALPWVAKALPFVAKAVPALSGISSAVSGAAGVASAAAPFLKFLPGAAASVGKHAANGMSGVQKANAERRITKAKNKYTKLEDKFNKKKWTYSKERLKLEYKHKKEGVEIDRENALNNSLHKDAINWNSWNHDLMIRNMEQEGLNAQYEKSQQLYADQINANSASARIAVEKEYDRLGDIEREKSFEFQDLQLQNLLKSDAIKAKGVRGLSADKSVQAQQAAYGRNTAILVEALTSNRRDVESTLKQIAFDQDAADLAAFAQKMLKPGILPIRPMPIQTPVAIFQDPRKPTKYDYGPKPIKGYQIPDTSGQTLLQTGLNAAAGVAGDAGRFLNSDRGQGLIDKGFGFVKGLLGGDSIGTTIGKTIVGAAAGSNRTTPSSERAWVPDDRIA